MKFRMCDTMGLEESQKLDAINFPYLLDGNIKDRFQFNPSVPITPGSPSFYTEPKLKDKAHVVVFVIDGSNVSVLSQLMVEKLKAMRALVNQRGVPLMTLMTKVDQIDPLVSENITSIYHSVEVRDTMEELSNKTGVPMSYIMPVKSYERETELEVAIDILTLTALRQILRLADDYFEEQMDFLNINPGADSDDEEYQAADGGASKHSMLEDNLNVQQQKGSGKKASSDKKNVL